MNDIMSLYADTTLREMICRTDPVPFSDPALSWVNAPSAEFIEYVKNCEPTGLDGVPWEENVYLKQPTFLVCQTHRFWTNLDLIKEHLPSTKVLLDLGAFPFTQDIVLREFAGYDGELIASSNYELADDARATLKKYSIKLTFVDLDPYVCGDLKEAERYPSRIDMPDDSVDMVLLLHVIEHLYHPMSCLREVTRVLRPGGKLIITTDNAMRIETLESLLWQGPFLHEPVQGTAAMSFHEWRGHVRFFNEGDLRAMVEDAGMRVEEVVYNDVIYNGFIDEYFRNPRRDLPAWKAELLGKRPAYRNDIAVIGEKR